MTTQREATAISDCLLSQDKLLISCSGIMWVAHWGRLQKKCGLGCESRQEGPACLQRAIMNHSVTGSITEHCERRKEAGLSFQQKHSQKTAPLSGQGTSLVKPKSSQTLNGCIQNWQKSCITHMLFPEGSLLITAATFLMARGNSVNEKKVTITLFHFHLPFLNKETEFP